MRLHVMSDLHLDGQDWKKGFADKLTGEADALIIAGDIFSLRHSDQALKVYAALSEKYPKVFYVPGNHEYYKTNPTSGNFVADMLEDKIPNFVRLKTNKVHIYMGKRFLGDTMWFKNDPFNQLFEHGLNDFYQIKDFNPWVYEENTKFRHWIDRECKEGDIVVTHHIPCRLSVGDDFKNDDFNRFFLCDVSGTIMQRAPALWVHGHGHDPADYELDKTRIYCNPKGYTREKRNPNFWDRITVEV